MTDRNVRQRELPQILDVNRSTVWRWLENGTLPLPARFLSTYLQRCRQ